MEQVYRIEIPVEALDVTDTAALRNLEATLQRIFTSAAHGKSTVKEAMDSINSGASTASSGLKNLESAIDNTADSFDQAGDAAQDAGNTEQQAASTAEGAAEKLGDAVDEVGDAYDDVGQSAQEAGSKSNSAFNNAASSADKFSQRVEKSNKSLREMFKEKLSLVMAAIDKASPVLKNIWNSAKSVAGKAWTVAVKMKDFITAPFKKLYNMITSPITIALSVAGVSMGAGDIISTYTDYTTGMSAVKALTGATEEEFKRLNDTAKELGATTKFTAAQASEGMQYLGMAGWDTNQIIDAMPGLLDLAAAGATDLGTAADIVSDVMTAMGMSANEASTAADIFARTATMTNTTISGMGESLKYAAPIAHSFGLSLSEVSTMVGMMGNAGIKASQAGTAIRSSLLSMASPSKEAAALMKQLGLSFSNADGSMKDMGTIIGDLQTAFKDLTAEQRLNYAETLFGTMASSAWLGMIDQGAEEYNRLYEAIDNSTGAAKEMANTQMDNLAGDFTLLQSAVDGMKISLMEQLGPYARRAVQWLTSKVPAVTDYLTNTVDRVIGKAKEAKEFLSGVFNSSEFKNADGFAEKFFVAWDKIVAEPFQAWWDGDGKAKVTGIMSDIGGQMGELLHGVILGVWAALKGEDIDFEGMNIGGIAQAGAEAAKSFVGSFASSLNLGEIISEAPGGLKALALGFGGIKLGSGIIGAAKTIGQLKLAFGGVVTTAAAASGATANVGAAAVTAAVGTGKAVAILGGLKTALAAIPVWGWVAAAAITAAAIGVKLYSDAQRRHRQELLDTGKAAKAMSEEYEDTVGNIQKVSKAWEAYQNVQNGKLNMEIVAHPMTEENLAVVRSEIERLEAEAAEIRVKLAEGGLSEEEENNLRAQLQHIEVMSLVLTVTIGKISGGQISSLNGQIAELSLEAAQVFAVLTAPTESDIEVMNEQIGMIELQKAEVEAKLKDGGLSDDEVATLNAQLQNLTLAELTIKAKMGTLTEEETAQASALVAQLEGTTPAIVLKYAMGTITEEDIAAANARIGEIELQKAEIEAKLKDGGLNSADKAALESEIETLNAEEITLQAITGDVDDSTLQTYMLEASGQSFDIYAKVQVNKLTDEEIATIKAEIEATDAAIIKLQAQIDAGGLDETAVAELNAQIATLTVDKIMLESAIQTLSAEEIGVLTAAIAKIEEDKIEIQAQIDGGGLPAEQVAALEKQIDDLNTREILIQATLGGLSDEEVAAYAASQLGIDYSDLVRASGGRFTQEDVDRGRITQEVFDNWIAEQTIVAENQRRDFRTQTEADRENIPELVERRDAQLGYQQYYDAMASGSFNDEQFLSGLNTRRQTLLSQYQAGEIDDDALFAGGSQIIQEARDHQWSDWWGAPMNFETMQSDELFGRYTGGLFGGPMFGHWEANSSVDPFGDALAELREQINTQDTNYDNAGVEASQWNDALLQQYQNEVRVQELDNFAGFGIQSENSLATITDLAGKYNELDAAGREMFASAVEGIAQVNEAATYISEEEKVNIGSILEQAQQSVVVSANTEVIGDVQTKLTEIAASYQGLEGDQAAAFNTDNIDAVNAALESLGLDKIESLDEINTALNEIAAIDPSGLDFNAVAASVESLGGSADDARARVESAQAQLDALNAKTVASAASSVGTISSRASSAEASVRSVESAMGSLDGKTANVHINVHQHGSTSVTLPHATGGIFSSAHVGLVAEDGPEAIIPLGSKRRERGLELWRRAGELLGVSEYAEGGILAPYSGALESLPDDVWNDNGDGDSPTPAPTGGRGLGTGGNTIAVNVTANPTFQIEGGTSPDEILAMLKSKSKELAELLGSAFAEELEDIVSNMV